MRLYIGIDIGTTHVKAVVARAGGSVLFESKKGYAISAPAPGFQEQDATEIFQAVLNVLRQACNAVVYKEDIACVAFSAAMHSVMAVDNSGHPLTPVITWADIRSNEYALRLKGTEEGNEIYEATATPVHPMLPICKIAWLRDQQPEIFQSAFKFISVKEYVFFQLFGEFITDFSIASATGLFDIQKREWCKEALRFAGITSDRLSKPVSSLTAVRSLREEYKALLGLTGDTPFLVGASDGCLANIGAGAVLPGELALTIGTSGAVRRFSDFPIKDAAQTLFNYAFDGNLFLSGGAINNGGIIMKWFVDGFMDKTRSDDENIAELMRLAETVSAGAGGLIFLPYLYGERAPVWDASAKGVFLGISSVHDRAHFVRAMLEGICFSLLQVVKAMERSGQPVQSIYANGGFIQSSLWLQVLSDILDKKIYVSYAADASAMGAVFLGMRFTGELGDWSEIKKLVKVDQEFLPVPGNHEVYMKNFAIYEQLYGKLKDDFQRIDRIQKEINAGV